MIEKETRYKVNGLALLSALDSTKGFFYKQANRFRTGSGKYIYTPIKVFDMTVSGGPEKFYLHAMIAASGDTCMTRHDFEISENDYKKFQQTKSQWFRLELLTKASNGLIVTKKIVADKHIDIRVTAALYKQLSKEAEKCKIPVSEYCRRHLEGKKPVAAFSDEELEKINKILQFSSDLVHYKSALENSFFKTLSTEERIKFLGTSDELSRFRMQINQAVQVINKLARSKT